AAQSHKNDFGRDHDIDSEEEKRQAIAKCQRRLEAARHLYEDGDLNREEYLRRKDENEREIAHWRAYTTETQNLTLHLMLCVEAIGRLAQLWNACTNEDKNRMARQIFEYIVY